MGASGSTLCILLWNNVRLNIYVNTSRAKYLAWIDCAYEECCLTTVINSSVLKSTVIPTMFFLNPQSRAKKRENVLFRR